MCVKVDETVSLNQSNNSTTSAVTTITTAGNSDSTKGRIIHYQMKKSS